MKSRVVIGFFALAAIGALTVACGGSGSTVSDLGSSSANRLVLDVRCATNTDCPAGFECEVEAEHGVSTSSCKSNDPVPAGATPTCPAGFEAEPEHGALACKPDGSSGGTGGTGGGSAAGSSGADDTAASGGGAAGSGGADDTPSTSTGTTPAGAACATTADCAAGLECEIDVEHGGTTTVCHLHGGGSSGGGKK
jgi:hypothetical protein